ncbi:hypothetical protein ABFS83_08G008500 [Erythranthe nasuta]
MELKVSPEKPGFSSSDLASDPEDKAISEGEDEDDDRNHKHRRREALSQSLGADQGLTRPYRKRNRPFENGYPYKEVDPQSGETWNSYNNASDRDFPSRFEKRHSNQASFSMPHNEFNPRLGGNQTLSGQIGPVRGRGREPFPWGIHDSRLGLVDVSSHIVQHGPLPPALFAGRGLPSISNAQTSWNAFGLVPGLPNGRLDSLHPLGLQGALRPAINPPMNIGIQRQRCRDFEERGFCLRGDMCPMEHGVNRIVIEDVQSLSQFNLPVSLSGSQLLGTSSGHGALPVNSKAFHAKSSRLGMTEDGFGLAGGVVGGSMVGASDVYDPDQPLWGNNGPETSAAVRALNQSNAHDTESFLEMDLSDQQNMAPIEGFNDERSLRNATNIGSQSSSVWGRIGSSKRSLGVKEKNDTVGTSSSYLDRDSKSEKELSAGLSDVPHQGKWTNVDGNGLLVKNHSDPVHSIRKQTPQALRTLCVSSIPVKDNKREALLSHFQKFGQVIDIHIPANSERAFVQFSRREEAEAAKKAPDAVMGNRFIKLWWANRDNIPDDGMSGTANVPITRRGTANNPAISHPFVLDKGKGSPHPASGKDGNGHPSVSQQSVYDHSKLVVANGPKAPPLQQKKLENLELLKEELRKKQEMLDQKRNEFRRQLDKLEKQAVGPNDVTASDLTPKKLKGETPSNHAKAETPKSLPRDNMKNANAISTEHTSNSNPTMKVQEPSKPSLHPPTSVGPPPLTVNRFKLDNRPTAFRIIPPLPAGLANVAALEEHFSTYGDISSVELEESELQGTSNASASSDTSSARVCFTTRRFAEKAFLHGKSWQGHKLQFMWLTSNNEGARPVNVSVASKISSNAATNVKPVGEDATIAKNQKKSSLETGEPVEADADSVEHDIDSKSISTEKQLS